MISTARGFIMFSAYVIASGRKHKTCTDQRDAGATNKNLQRTGRCPKQLGGLGNVTARGLSRVRGNTNRKSAGGVR